MSGSTRKIQIQLFLCYLGTWDYNITVLIVYVQCYFPMHILCPWECDITRIHHRTKTQLWFIFASPYRHALFSNLWM